MSYTFQYLYDDIRSDLITGDVKNYYGSINVSPDLQRDDQYLATSGSGSGFLGIAPVVLYGGGAALILLIVFFVLRRKRSTVSI